MSSESTIAIPELDSDGVLWLETEASGLLSEASAVILCRDLDAVEDILKMEESVLLRQMPHEEIESLIVEIGMVLQYAASMNAQSIAAGTGWPNHPQFRPKLFLGFSCIAECTIKMIISGA